MPDHVAVAAGGDDTLDLAVDEHRLVGVGVGIVRLDGEADALPLEPLALGLDQRLAADEVALVEPDESVQAGLERRDFRGQLGTPGPVALLQAQGVHGPGAEVGDAGRLAGGHERLVER